MTAIVALRTSQLTDQVIAGAEAASIGESSASLKEGDVLSMEDAIKALLTHRRATTRDRAQDTVGAKLEARAAHRRYLLPR